MATILDDLMSKCCKFITNLVQKEVNMLLGVKDELQNLQSWMESIQRLLQDAEKRKFDDSAIDLWLSQLKDLMYDVDDIIDLCRIKGPQLLAEQDPKSKTSPVCSNFSSASSFVTSIPLRHDIGNRIKELNERLNKINKSKERFDLKDFPTAKTLQITQVDKSKTSPMVDPWFTGREVENDANRLVNLLVAEKVEENCRLFAIVGMGGIGKTTLAQKIFNHHKINSHFIAVWSCVSQTYSEIELLQQIIRDAKGSYMNANTKSELLTCLRDSVSLDRSLFLVLDDVWRADVWVDLLRVPLYNAKKRVRVLVTTRDENVAQEMKAAHIHHVMKLSIESSWDMLRRQIFSDEEEELANGLKDIGLKIVEKCRCLPLAIKAIVIVLKKQRTRKAWEYVLMNETWSITNHPEDFRGALYLSFEDLPSHLKQCFLYFSLYREDILLFRRSFIKLWVAEGFVTEQEGSLMEVLAEEYFNELVKRNLLHPEPFINISAGSICKMHDLFRSLSLFLSKGETSCGEANVKNSTTSIKLRRLSVENKKVAAGQIFDSVADLGALRTLLASSSDLLLDDKRLSQLLSLRVLAVSNTNIEILSDSIGKLVHLRYLDLSSTNIKAIPKSIEHLPCLQFLDISYCKKLTQLPSEITQLHNLRYLNIRNTPLSFMPKGIGKLQQLNYLHDFMVIDDDSSSKLEDLNTLKKMRTLSICHLKRAQSGANILNELSYLSELELHFSKYNTEPSSSEPSAEEKLAVEKLFDELKPPRSLEKLKIVGFLGSRFPNWMALSSFKICVPFLSTLELAGITSCTQLPPLGQLPELKELVIQLVTEVKKIGPEFLGCGINSTTRIAFPKLERLRVYNMFKLKEWSFGEQVEVMPRLQKLNINGCPSLKQLPKGLKYTAMKSLSIERADSLKSVDNLPPETEDLEIIHNKNLKKICCLPKLKYLRIEFCEALCYVEKLDSLHQLTLHFLEQKSLPEWLLMLLQQRGLQDDTNEDFFLDMVCPVEVLRRCIKGGSYWGIIKHIPEVSAYAIGKGYLRYIKQPYVYDTNL